MSSDGPSPQARKRVLLGQISGVHGIKGHVLVRTYSAEPAGIAAYGPLENEAGNRSFSLKILRVTDKGVVAIIDGVPDRTAAEALRGTKLYVERSKLPKPADGEYYHIDLIGLAAVDASGKDFGKVIAVENYGAGDLLEIQRHGTSETDLVPLTDAFVPTIDFERGIAVINQPVLVDADGEDNGQETQ